MVSCGNFVQATASHHVHVRTQCNRNAVWQHSFSVSHLLCVWSSSWLTEGFGSSQMVKSRGVVCVKTGTEAYVFNDKSLEDNGKASIFKWYETERWYYCWKQYYNFQCVPFENFIHLSAIVHKQGTFLYYTEQYVNNVKNGWAGNSASSGVAGSKQVEVQNYSYSLLVGTGNAEPKLQQRCSHRGKTLIPPLVYHSVMTDCWWILLQKKHVQKAWSGAEEYSIKQQNRSILISIHMLNSYYFLFRSLYINIKYIVVIHIFAVYNFEFC